MFFRRRQRRGPYALAAASILPSFVRTVVLVMVVGGMLFLIGSWVLKLFGAGNQIARASVLLIVEERGPVNVSIEGGAVQRAEDTLKLYAGDRVSTGGGANATLFFFDGSRARLGPQTDVELVDSARGTKESTVEFTVERGSLFLQTPTLAVFSGSVLRTVRAGALTLTVPTGVELVVGVDSALEVFQADGLGIELRVRGFSGPIVIGEGQQLRLPNDVKPGADLYAYREPLGSARAAQSFVQESRTAVHRVVAVRPVSAPAVEEILTVTEPTESAVIEATTVRVAGTMAEHVAQVRVNGYPAVLNRALGTFQQELSLRDEEEMAINIEALDDKGVVLQEIQRLVRREITVAESPAITVPAKDGETYRTSRTEFEIRGTAPKGTAGIIVNDYRLQLFKPGSLTWSYLADTELRNLVPGKNVFEVRAIDEAGSFSTPVKITILLEEGPQGVVAGEGGAGAIAAPSSVPPAELPSNPPLKPGTLTVTDPTPGTAHTATGSEILIEGTTDPLTASVWVNDYRLQLYRPGKTTWNYIAKQEFRNLKPGKNVYRIIARNAKDEIIDTVEYVVQY